MTTEAMPSEVGLSEGLGQVACATCGEAPYYTKAHIDAAVAAERERCAKLCDLHSRLTWNDDRKEQSRVLAAEIRRGA